MFHAPIPNEIQKQYSQSLDIYKHVFTAHHTINSVVGHHTQDLLTYLLTTFRWRTWSGLSVIPGMRLCCPAHWECTQRATTHKTAEQQQHNTLWMVGKMMRLVAEWAQFNSRLRRERIDILCKKCLFYGCVCVYFCACLFASWNPHMASLNMNSIDLYNATVRVKHGARHDHNGNTPRRHPGRHPGKKCLAYSENNYKGCQHPLAYSVADGCWFALQIGATITESVFCLPVTKCAQLSTLRQSQFIEWTLCNFVVVMCDPKIMYLRLSVSIYSRALEGRGGRHSYEIPHQNTGELFMPNICKIFARLQNKN